MKLIEAGIKQRLKALNIFLKDIYHLQFIIKNGIIPGPLIYSCPNFLREMLNVDVPFDIYTHVAGVDLIRDHDGSFYVLEDNLRTPSGVSYMLENRSITYRIFPTCCLKIMSVRLKTLLIFYIKTCYPFTYSVKIKKFL